MKNLPKFLISTGLIFLTHAAAFAAQTGFGKAAEGMLEPVGLFADFMYAGCILIGGGFVFASIIKYSEHRRSPLMVPISTVILLFISGSLLLLMPFLSYIYSHAVGFSFLK